MPRPSLTPAAADVSLRGPAQEPQMAGGSRRLFAILGALMAFTAMSTDLYLPALPTLMTAFNTDSGRIQLTLSGFLIGFSLGQLFWGPIADRYGRRIPVAIGVVLFIIGSVGCALAVSVEQMIGWRIVQALGACAGPVLARAMVRDLYGRERSAQMLSSLLLIMGIAPLVAPVLGGQILLFWSWQGTFWVLAGFGTLVLFGLLTLPETLPPERRVLEPLSGVVTGYALLLRSPKLMGYAISGGFFFSGIYAYIAGTPFAYIEYHHVAPQAYGLLFGLNILGMMLANLLNSRLVMRLGTDRLFRFGAAVIAVAGVSLALNARFGWGGLPGLVVPLFFYVSMAGFIIANSVAGALAIFPQRAGAASALVGALHYGSGILSTALLGWFADGTPWPMGWVIGASGVGALASALLLVRTPPAPRRG